MIRIIIGLLRSKILLLLISLSLFGMCSKAPTEVKGHLNGLEDKKTVLFEAKKGQTLNAKLTTPKPGNIRINEIISPSGISDGPFGQDIKYSLNETGTWKLLIAGSLMQGDSYYGDFTVIFNIK